MKLYFTYFTMLFLFFGCNSDNATNDSIQPSIIETNQTTPQTPISDIIDKDINQSSIIELNTQVANSNQIDIIDNTDPLLKYQWYLDNQGQDVGNAQGGVFGEDINIKDVWNKFTGKGIKIAIVDTGIDSKHLDLQNVDQNLSFRYSDEKHTSDLTQTQENASFANAHGTACAGIIAAQNNSVGIRGVAYNATLIGLNVYSNPSDETFLRALQYKGIDISSNSWGNSSYSLFDDTFTVEGIQEGLKNGRDGKGTIYVFASSNLATNANTFTPTSLRGVVTVAATDADGKQASYSNYGSNILLSAYGGEYGIKKVAIVTSDLTGKKFGMDDDIIDSLEENDGNYTAVMNGTSAASPMVSGVVALMLEANPNLTWRDVSYILAISARQNDASDDSWHTNGAGYYVSEKYGFGIVDANKSVNLALSFTHLNDEQNSTIYTNTTSQAIPDNNTKGITSSVDVLENMLVEHIDVWVDITHPCIKDLTIKLVSPSETVSNLAYSDNINGKYENWRFGVAQMLDERSSGKWSLEVIDPKGGCNGKLNKFSLKIYGRKQ